MELSSLLSAAHIPERLHYVFVLLRLMKCDDEYQRRALTGGIAMWAVGIDSALEEANPMVGGVTYKTRRAHEVGGKTLLGLRLARNEIAHGEALVTASGASAPFTFPLVFHLRFIRRDALARNHRARSGKSLKAAHLDLYESFVAEQDPEVVLQRVYDWLIETTGAR